MSKMQTLRKITESNDLNKDKNGCTKISYKTNYFSYLKSCKDWPNSTGIFSSISHNYRGLWYVQEF